jgi:hypothetical protein
MPISVRPWEAKRTDETRGVEKALNDAGFPEADAYRYNSASIRVRVIDPRFEGLADEARYGMVEPILDRLPEATQSDILQLLIFAPSELAASKVFADALRKRFLNAEFEEPSPSVL